MNSVYFVYTAEYHQHIGIFDSIGSAKKYLKKVCKPLDNGSFDTNVFYFKTTFKNQKNPRQWTIVIEENELNKPLKTFSDLYE